MAGEASHTPSMPPMRNIATKPQAKSIGSSSRILPRHIVASQIQNSTPVGIEMSSVVAEKKDRLGTSPVVNM